MIKVVGKWVIDSDGRQYIGGKLTLRTLKDGTTEQYIQTPFYCTTFAGCVKTISERLRMQAIKDADGDLKAAAMAIQAADRRLIKAIGIFDELEVVQRGQAATR